MTCEVSPRDVVAACLPDPAELGEQDARGHLRRHVGDRHRYRRQAPRGLPAPRRGQRLDDEPSTVSQAVVWQTAVNPVVALELLASGAWSGAGVLGPEAFPADPFLDLLDEHGAPWGLERDATAAATAGST